MSPRQRRAGQPRFWCRVPEQFGRDDRAHWYAARDTARERGELAAAKAQHTLALRIWAETRAPGRNLLEIAPTLGLTYDTLTRLLRGQTPMQLWQEETLRASFELPTRAEPIDRTRVGEPE